MKITGWKLSMKTELQVPKNQFVVFSLAQFQCIESFVGCIFMVNQLHSNITLQSVVKRNKWCNVKHIGVWSSIERWRLPLSGNSVADSLFASGPENGTMLWPLLSLVYTVFQELDLVLGVLTRLKQGKWVLEGRLPAWMPALKNPNLRHLDQMMAH